MKTNNYRFSRPRTRQSPRAAMRAEFLRYQQESLKGLHGLAKILAGLQCRQQPPVDPI
jgi:hypothetical protein